MDNERARNKHLALYDIARSHVDTLPDELEEYDRKFRS